MPKFMNFLNSPFKRIIFYIYPLCVFLVSPQLLPPQNLPQLIFRIVVFLSAYIILGVQVYWMIMIIKRIYKKRKERKKW